jgi:hypothetical protein
MYRQGTRANDRDHDRCGDPRGDVAVVPLLGLLSWPIRMLLYVTPWSRAERAAGELHLLRVSQ